MNEASVFSSKYPLKKITDVCMVIAGQSPESKYYNSDGKGLPFYQGKKEFTKKFLGKPTIWTSKITKEAQEDDILMSVRAPVGPVNFATQKICIGRGLAAIRSSEKVNKNYLFYFLLMVESEIEGNDGAIFNSINKDQIGEIEIPIPPLSEQNHIVAILDDAFTAFDQGKANIEKNIENAREIFQSRLMEIFSRNDRGWEETKLGEVCYKITDGKHGDCKNEQNSEYYFLSAKDVFNDTLNYEKARQISKKDFEETHRRTDLKPGDVLVTNSGTIGRMALAPDDEKTYRTIFQKSVAIIKPKNDILNSDFCKYILESDLDKLVNISAGTAQQNLLIGDLKTHTIYLPSIEEQRMIVNQLDEFKKQSLKLCRQYQTKFDLIEELKKSLLQKAFAGELT
ncbi:MAG: restriction endonuclease subunit S [Methanoregula sp.]|nr:restriction endonuclease subunit S [Methanoregula sp.]